MIMHQTGYVDALNGKAEVRVKVNFLKMEESDETHHGSYNNPAVHQVLLYTGFIRIICSPANNNLTNLANFEPLYKIGVGGFLAVPASQKKNSAGIKY